MRPTKSSSKKINIIIRDKIKKNQENNKTSKRSNQKNEDLIGYKN
jgi:hypothetical protein